MSANSAAKTLAIIHPKMPLINQPVNLSQPAPAGSVHEVQVLPKKKRPYCLWTKKDESLLLEWLEHNYDRWRSTGIVNKSTGKKKSSGMTKTALSKEIQAHLKASDGTKAYETENILSKIDQWERKYREVNDWLGKTGTGVDPEKTRDEKLNDQTLIDAIVEKCKYFFELEKFMGSRPNNNPPFLGDSEDGMGDAEAHLLTADVIEADEKPVATAAPAGPGATAAPAEPGATAAPAGPGATGASAGPGATGAPAGPGATGAPAGPGATGAPAGPGATAAPAEPGATAAPAGPGATGAPAGPGATGAPAGPGAPAAPAGPRAAAGSAGARMRGTTDKRKRRLQKRNIDDGGLDARDLEEAAISKEDSEDEDDSKRRKKSKPQSVPEIMQSLTKSKESKDDKKLEIRKMEIELRMFHKVQELEFRREEKKAEIELRKMERESETELRRAELEVRKLKAENQREMIRQMAARQVNN